MLNKTTNKRKDNKMSNFTTNIPNTTKNTTFVDPLSLLCNVTTIYELGDFPDVATYCRHCDPVNYWCGRYDGKRAFQLAYLVLVIVVGVFGNLLVISSINYARRLYKHGNVFVVNLAIVDLMLTGVYLPHVFANVLKTEQAIDDVTCYVFGVFVFFACTCSIYNLALIAVNRYLSIIHSTLYNKMFSKKRIIIFAVLSWVWSFALGLPIITGWSSSGYDWKMQICSWNDTYDLSYNWFASVTAVFFPLIVTTFCYISLFRAVRKKSMTRKSLSTNTDRRKSIKKKTTKKELMLLRTLALTVVVFFLSWGGYALVIIIDPRGINHNAKKVFGWLGLSNSCLNFIIYGLMNKVYRRDYFRLLKKIFCKESQPTVQLITQ